jgi:two-component system sensor histidine kinase QseC
VLRTRSIRSRLLIGILCALTLILGSSAWWSYGVARHESQELFGARLATSARVLEALVARQVRHATIASPLVITLPRALEHATTDQETDLGHPYETKIAFQIWDDEGRLLVRSVSAPERPFSPNAAGFKSEVVDGVPYHVFVLRSANTWIQVAEKNEVRDELIRNLGFAVMTPLIAGAALLLVVVNALVLYGLAPLRQLAANIEKRQPDSAGALEMRNVPKELTGVVRALNALLRRVELAFERERRFTDAAAHELRTPIAALKIHADNIARAENETERAQSMRKLKQSLERTSKLAARMLEYSRTQNASEHEERVAIWLPDLVRETSSVTDHVRQAKAQRLTITAADGAANAYVLGEPGKIQRLVANLLDNASRYAPAGSTIEAVIRSDAERVVLSIANHGPAIPPELRERVFEPYYRLPGSGSEGSGLGLAIVKEIAAQHSASIELSSITGTEGTVVEVTFPPSPAPSELPALAPERHEKVTGGSATAVN